MIRLSEDVSKYATLKCRQNDLLSKELLDILSNLYEILLLVIYKENRHVLDHLR